MAIETESGGFRRTAAATIWRRLAALALLLFLAAGGVSLTACGTADEASSGPDYGKELAGSPGPLAGLHRQGDEQIKGGLSAFEQRMAELKGYPAVVNIWASWCGPCRAEFPHFQEAAGAMGKKVAFLAVNPDDDADAAATFLETHPVPYPSYFDPDKEIAESLGVPRMIPATAFFNRQGEQTYTKFGSYPDTASLKADVKAHAINGRAE